MNWYELIIPKSIHHYHTENRFRVEQSKERKLSHEWRESIVSGKNEGMMVF